jgi:predicted small secreted protein
VRSESRFTLTIGVGRDVQSVYTGLNPLNFILKHFSADLLSESRCALIIGVGRDVQSVYTDLNPLNFIRKHCCFVWEEVQFFSDRFMRCCMTDIFL